MQPMHLTRRKPSEADREKARPEPPAETTSPRRELVDAATKQRMERLASEAAAIAGCNPPVVGYQDESSYCPVSAVSGKKELRIIVDPLVVAWSDDELRAIFAQRLCGRNIKGAHGMPLAGLASLMCAFLALPTAIIGSLAMLGSGGRLIPWMACQSFLTVPSLATQIRKAKAWRQADARYLEAGGEARPLMSALRKSQRGGRDAERSGAVAEFFAAFFFSGLSPEAAIRHRLHLLRPTVRAEFARQRNATMATTPESEASELNLRTETLEMARDGRWGSPEIARQRSVLTLD